MYLIALIAIGILELSLGVLALARNRRSATNLAFAGVVLFAFLWSVVNYLADHPIAPGLALFWNRSAFAVAFLQGAFLFLFGSVFPYHFKRMERLSLAVLLPLGVLLAILTLATGLIVARVEFLDWGTNVVPGAAYPSFIAFMSLTVMGTLVALSVKYRRSRGIEKYQLLYLFIGFFVTAAIALTTNLFLPLIVGDNASAKYGPLSMIFLIAFAVYAIVRHRLMDIRIAMRKAFLHAAVSATMLAFILGAIFLVARFLAKRIPDLTLVFTGSIAMAVALGFLTPLTRFFERIANRYFFTSLYNYQATLEDLARGLTSVIEIRKVLDLIVETIMRTMGLDRAGVLLLSPEKNARRYVIAKVIGFNEQNGISLVRDNFLVQWLLRHRTPVVLEELGRLIEESGKAGERGKLLRLKTNMTRIEASLCLPLFSKDELIAIIVLGSKITKDPYTSEDLRLLETIANQAAVAVQNARLYEQVEEFSRTLQKKVREQTKDIAEKNARLETLLRMKSEFLSIASHQLRTPLTAIRGLLAMQAEGDFDKLPPEDLKRQQQNMLDSANRLSNIVNDLLDAMELEGGVPTLDLSPVDLAVLAREIGQELKPNYDRKGLTFAVRPPEPPLPPVSVDAKMFREALENLIDNAEKYTNKGGVTVALSRRNGSAVIAVTDTGIGIPKTDMPRLFQKFSRGEKSSYQHTDGSGLGLFIAKSIIANHHGTISIDSPGEGKGTTVTVTVPIAPPEEKNP